MRFGGDVQYQTGVAFSEIGKGVSETVSKRIQQRNSDNSRIVLNCKGKPLGRFCHVLCSVNQFL